MRRPGRIVGWLTAAVLLGWGLSWGIPRLPAALAEIDWFRVRDVSVEGLRYLAEQEVVRILAIPPTANLWDDLGPAAARLAAHPLVAGVQIQRRPPRRLLVRIAERQPVALMPTPTLEPVDREGRVLPLDPVRHRLDLPVLRHDGPATGAAAQAEIAAAAREAARLAEADPAFWEGVSIVTAEGSDELTLEWGEASVRLRFAIPLAQTRLREAMAVLTDATDRGGDPPAHLDLRFADQVVVRWRETNRGVE